MAELVRFLVLVPLQLLVFVGLPYWIWRRLKRTRPSAMPMPIVDDGSGGRIVPVRATFAGVRGVPWIALATNNLNPRLTISAGGMTFRVLRTQQRRFDEIEQVYLRILGATVLLSFVFQGTAFTFDANVGSVETATAVLALLPGHVKRTDRAAALG